MRERRRKSREVYVLREYVEAVLAAVLMALLCRAFVITAYKVPTSSMTPTLKVGDCVFAWRLPFGVRLPFTDYKIVKAQVPQRGDVVVFRYPKNPRVLFIKRVVGVPGDRIEIKNHHLMINEKLLTTTSTTDREREQALDDIPAKDAYVLLKEQNRDREYFVMHYRLAQDDSFAPTVVPDGSVFVMGDNRDASDDSRSWGMVPLDNLEARVFIIWASFDWVHRHHFLSLPSFRWGRLFSLVQ